MAAAQTLLLWAAASLAAAAPQLDFGAPSPVAVGQLAGNSLDQGQIVTEVVATLQPSIAAAVAEALAGLRSSSAAVEREAFEQELAADPAINTLAEYNYEYKVADNDAQTYISKQESREGDSLTGSYSYVNPAGTLVTVNYEAGPMGYSQTVEEQAGFVTIRAKPVNNRAAEEAAAAAAAAEAAAAAAAREEAARLARERAAAQAAEAARLEAERQAAYQQKLIAQIVTSLQPQISSAVQTAISSSSSAVSSVPAPAARTGVIDTFGNGVSVSIDTPEFQIEY